MQAHLSRKLDLKEVSDQYVPEFSSVFKRNMIGCSESALCTELRRFEDNAQAADECGRSDFPAAGRPVV
jgi:hypothetical protein